MDVWPGTPFPLGAQYDGSRADFSVLSQVADRVELCLFDGQGRQTRVDLPEVGPGQRYGFRVHGPWDPEAGTAAIRPSSCWTPTPRPLRARNYWGYGTIGYLTPHSEYAADRRPGAVVAEKGGPGCKG